MYLHFFIIIISDDNVWAVIMLKMWTFDGSGKYLVKLK